LDEAITDSVSVAGPRRRLEVLIAEGRVKPDPMQADVATRLDALHRALGGWAPKRPHKSTWLGLFKRDKTALAEPHGLYIHGSVGRGKSMVMDLFFSGAPVKHKRRVHFHAFMAEMHHRLHAFRQATKGTQADPLPLVAAEVAKTSWLLCFDEFVVNDIADAMILGRLFEALLAEGVVIVATSNFAPPDLYKDGLQRDRFEPFIRMIEAKLDVVSLDGPTDYRMARLVGRPVYHTPLDARAQQAMDATWEDLTDGVKVAAIDLDVNGRKLHVAQAAKGVARFGFEDLCRANLGPSDYLAIADAFHTVLLDGVPLLGVSNHNEARRFITLIDNLYERRTRFICSAEASADRLYPEGRGAFEFQRTVSRLMEMQAADYRDRQPAEAA
jgi:cell division protein ZapE